MTVEPGFGGQSFMAESTMPKLAVAARGAALGSSGLDVRLQVDGGITVDTIGIAAEAGADTFVAGSRVFGADDRRGRDRGPAGGRDRRARALTAASRPSGSV